MVEGPTFRYGAKRGGDIDTLRRAGVVCGFDVIVVDPVDVESSDGGRVVVSSSLVREALSTGRIDLATRALGRPYMIEGKVVWGAVAAAVWEWPPRTSSRRII